MVVSKFIKLLIFVVAMGVGFSTILFLLFIKKKEITTLTQRNALNIEDNDLIFT